MMKTIKEISPAGESWSAGYVGEEKTRMKGTSGTDNDNYDTTRERHATFGVDAPGNPINVVGQVAQLVVWSDAQRSRPSAVGACRHGFATLNTTFGGG